MRQRRLFARAQEIEIDLAEALACLPTRGAYAWLRNAAGVLGWGTAVRVDAGTGTERFGAAQRGVALLEDLVYDGPPGGTPLAFAAFTFDRDSAGSCVILPEATLRLEGGTANLTVTSTTHEGLETKWADARANVGRARARREGNDRIRYSGSSRSEIEWLEAAATAIDLLERNALDKVVLARDIRVWSRDDFDVVRLAERLAARFPGCFTYVHEGLVGSSPELLVRRTGSEIESVVLAGSARRGDSRRDDDRYGRALLESGKERIEHELAVASVTGPLGEICSSVEVDGPRLLRLANVQHLSTAVSAQLDEPRTTLEIASLLHPTAAVAGTPRDDALEVIASLEKLDRARYAGVVGILGGGGDGEVALALRCGEFDGPRGRLFAGAGLVKGSVPEAELEETRLKVRAMETALEGGA